jgi:hypothetical protein
MARSTGTSSVTRCYGVTMLRNGYGPTTDLPAQRGVLCWAVLSRRVQALLLLAWSLLVVLLQRVGRTVSGLELFHQNYGADRLGPLTEAERAELPRYSGCIACGRCDWGEADRVAASRGAYPGLMQLVLASSRAMPDFDAAARGFAHVPETVLQCKVARCPVLLPFPDLARFVRAKAQAASGLALGTGHPVAGLLEPAGPASS